MNVDQISHRKKETSKIRKRFEVKLNDQFWTYEEYEHIIRDEVYSQIPREQFKFFDWVLRCCKKYCINLPDDDDDEEYDSDS